MALTPEDLIDHIRKYIDKVLHDPDLRRARQLLVVEQFNNPELSEIFTRLNYDDVMTFARGMIHTYVEQDILIGGDEQMMASWFCMPVFGWLNLCSREPAREKEVLNFIERHIKLFFEVFGKK